MTKSSVAVRAKHIFPHHHPSTAGSLINTNLLVATNLFVQVTTMTNAKLLRSLENCIRVGRPLLIEDITEHIEPALEPVLQKATFK